MKGDVRGKVGTGGGDEGQGGQNFIINKKKKQLPTKWFGRPNSAE